MKKLILILLIVPLLFITTSCNKETEVTYEEILYLDEGYIIEPDDNLNENTYSSGRNRRYTYHEVEINFESYYIITLYVAREMKYSMELSVSPLFYFTDQQDMKYVRFNSFEDIKENIGDLQYAGSWVVYDGVITKDVINDIEHNVNIKYTERILSNVFSKDFTYTRRLTHNKMLILEQENIELYLSKNNHFTFLSNEYISLFGHIILSVDGKEYIEYCNYTSDVKDLIIKDSSISEKPLIEKQVFIDYIKKLGENYEAK